MGAPKSLQMVIAAMKLRRLLLGRKVMTKLDNIFKSRDITLPTKVHLVRAMVFPVVMYGCMPGASERHSTRDKCHEERFSAYAKAGSRLREFPRIFLSIYPPKPESAYFIALFSHL